jgi:hypothetical protein
MAVTVDDRGDVVVALSASSSGGGDECCGGGEAVLEDLRLLPMAGTKAVVVGWRLQRLLLLLPPASSYSGLVAAKKFPLKKKPGTVRFCFML